MEGAQENPAESGSSVPWSEELADSARVPEVSLSEESEGCTRPLEAAPKKLCGYLSKFGGKGPIRGWKSRWFFFDERKCHLYYSRTAQDANPLDSIDLSSAVFDCKADAEEGTFEIKTPNRIITLKKHSVQHPGQQADPRSRPQTPRRRLPTERGGAKRGAGLSPRPWCPRERSSKFSEAYTQVLSDHQSHSESQEPEQHLPALQRRARAEPNCPGESTGLGAAGSDAHQGAKGSEGAGEDPAQGAGGSPAGEEGVQRIPGSGPGQGPAGAGAPQSAADCGAGPAGGGPGAGAGEPGADGKPAGAGDSGAAAARAAAPGQESGQAAGHLQALREGHAGLHEGPGGGRQGLPEPTGEDGAPEAATVIPLSPSCRPWLSPISQGPLGAQEDDMEAYRTQNRFLNSEIHQVTKIWRKVAEKEKALLMKCAYLQAQNCRVESKYLAGLRRLQEALGAEAGECSELLRQLIQEALQWEASEASAESAVLGPSAVSEYDEYGFLTVPSYEVEDLRLLAKIQALEVHSHQLLAHEAVQRPLRERWAALGELAPSAELKQLLRAGVPHEHRPRVWRWLIRRRVQHLQAPGCYQELLSRGQACKHPAARQIELDLNRTFPNNKHFTCPTSGFPDKLRRVLLAFSWQNPTIGYCQGLNRLAAIALLVLDEEESAFWCLVAIVETIMPADYYSKTLLASQVDQRVLQDLLLEKLPRLTAHLGQRRVDLSFITFNWFLVVFADSLISNILLQVWDAFLYEGIKVVFRYALAIFKYNEEALLRLQDSLEIYQYLHFFTKTICDSRKLMHIAFNNMNPFPMKQLRQLRAAHRERLQAELNELEQLKAEYLETRAAQGPSAPEGCPSEDEGDTEP
ncbi:TBC1 domain family member 2A isoform X3 [Cervus elaphus]|uniref:TBC1 domain family member 2A isoform X3 n=1 Tax=Cervus elaphus TaxID=9860 RepID=UPI001CC325A8|nr:TBC1 domain family member 2A isoform X3 [Cervus elaphus]